MKKVSVVKITIIVTLFALLILFYAGFSGNWFNSEQHDQAMQNQVVTEAKNKEVGLQQSPGDMANSETATQSALGLDAADNSRNVKMDYDADWCIAQVDLNQQDIAYYHSQLDDWYLSRGHISPPMPNSYISDRSQYLVPYTELAKDALLEQLNKDDEYAMIAALSRHDIDIESKRKIAQRLVVKGHTGTALSHLVITEVSYAEMSFNKAEQVTEEIQAAMHRAMAYIAYGIKQHDLGAAFTFIVTVNSTNFPIELKPIRSLGKDNDVADYIDKLEGFIETARAKQHFTLPTPNALSKAAQHNFDTTLAHLTRVYAYELGALKGVLPDTASGMLEASECVQRQVEFINTLESGRKVQPAVR